MNEDFEVLEEERYLPPPKGEWLISTWDNPWNPFDHEIEWQRFDEGHGYCTNGLIARLTNVGESSFFTEDSEEEIERAMKKIVTTFPLLYRYVKKGEQPVVKVLTEE